MWSKLFPCLFFLSFSLIVQSQESENTPMRVIHCSAVDQAATIRNIHVDGNNNKFVAADEDLYQIYSADNATILTLTEENWSLLMQTDGNAIFNTLAAQIKRIIQPDADSSSTIDPNLISVAHYDAEKEHLWIGTNGAGVYQLAVDDESLRLLQHLTADNSKLKSNQINAILVDKYQRRWVGTDQGVLFGEKDGWKLYEKRDRIVAVTALGPDVWILGEDILWRVDDRKRWIPGDVDPKLYEGSVKDIQYDSEGRLWVASEVITRYDVVNDKVEVFGKAQGFSSKDVSCIRIDQEDALWIGTNDKGLFLIEKQEVMTVSCEVEKGKSCEEGNQDAALSVKVFGGEAPYEYLWSSGQETENPRGLAPGLYTVTVTDSKGLTRQASAKIEGARLNASISLRQDATGTDGQDGVAKVSVNGGSPGYTYLWDNGESGALATQLTAGKHSVSITDRLGCTTSASVEVGQKVIEKPQAEPEVIAETSSPSNPTPTPPETPSTPETPEVPSPPTPPEILTPLQLRLQQSGQLLCAGDRNIEIAAIVEGGKTPYQYQWNSNQLKGAQIDQLGAGTYELTITDATGKQKIANISIDALSPLNIKIREDQQATNDRSRDGKASVRVSGGAGNYVILWDNGETGTTARKLRVGKHSVKVSDGNGCEATTTIVIGKKIIPELNAATLRKGQTIRMKQLFFEADSTQLSGTSIPVLDELQLFLDNNPQITIEVGGHTNNLPPDEYCDRLSTERAKSVVDYLAKKGIASERLQYKGYGKRKPLVSNRTATGRRKNQRVEVKILKLGG
ncbi:MAG: OmpA family protein [Bacteroidota bacterium]